MAARGRRPKFASAPALTAQPGRCVHGIQGLEEKKATRCVHGFCTHRTKALLYTFARVDDLDSLCSFKTRLLCICLKKHLPLIDVNENYTKVLSLKWRLQRPIVEYLNRAKKGLGEIQSKEEQMRDRGQLT